jgi:GNAT superfamily N-acetyltransferase
VIREATEDDIPRLVEMGERFLTETVYRGRVAVNPRAMARTVAQLLVSETGAVFVSERDAQVVGMIGVLFFENPITGEPTVSELFWWVEPEARGSGVRLLKRAEQWALAAGAHKVHMIAPTPDVAQLYERMGYGYLEAAYQKAIA